MMSDRHYHILMGKSDRHNIRSRAGAADGRRRLWGTADSGYGEYTRDTVHVVSGNHGAPRPSPSVLRVVRWSAWITYV